MLMRRILLGLLCMIWLVPFRLYGTGDGRPTLRMLCIGNSFSLDGTALLPALLADMGIPETDYGIDCAVVAGASLEYWWKQYGGDHPVEALYHMGGALQPESRTWTLRELLREPWDVVVVQQASRVSDRYGTIDPYLKRLVEAIRTQNPHGQTMCVAWQMTWSGAPPQATGPVGEKGWQRIARTARAVERKHDIDALIPAGTALENARRTLHAGRLGLTRDGLHLAHGLGRYVAALTWYETLCAPVFGRSALGHSPSPLVRGVDATEDGFLPVTDGNYLDCQRAVESALRDPYHTAGHYTAPPLPSLYLTWFGGDGGGQMRDAHLEFYAEGTVVGHSPAYSDSCRICLSDNGVGDFDGRKGDMTLYLRHTVDCGMGQGEALPAGWDCAGVWKLDAMAEDPSRLRGMLCHALWRDMGWDRMAGGILSGQEYVEVYVNGKYHGVYGMGRYPSLLPDTLGDIPVSGGILYHCRRNRTPASEGRLIEDCPVGCSWGDWDLMAVAAADDCAGTPVPYSCLWEPLESLIALAERTADDVDYVAAHLYDHLNRSNLVDYCLLHQVINPVGRAPFYGAVLWCPQPADSAILWMSPGPLPSGWGRDEGGQRSEVLSSAAILPWAGHTPLARLYEAPESGGWSQDAGSRWNVLRDNVLSGANVFRRIDALAERLQATGAWDREWRRWSADDERLPENLDDELSDMKRWYRRQHLRLSRLYKDALTAIPVRNIGDAPIYLPNGVRTDHIPFGLYIRGGMKYFHRCP